MAYSDAEKTEALIRLAINKYDYAKTAEQTGVTVRSLRNWEKSFPKKTVPELLDRAIERMLMNIPADWKGNDWAIALGILMDKWLLAQGMATERTESLAGWLTGLPENELDELTKQFEAAARSSNTKSRKAKA